ncbi:uncharacterized protein LOC126740993 isoform X2 [Anthonomus grandis grandis]|uniref:uncharacterized protein LOC126740993 isoform X2 n=1 Tax=Anthonomus grandis grandis TaxID=2921223 RepID=UPI0021652E65|nr:uncharacterized protein LOC126740993 isoform X2 [Anthonomus grandis grandis]
MEDVSKDSGHRPSVSMPSLDAVDDFPAQTATTEENKISPFVNTDSFISTASTETLESAGASIDSFSEENTITAVDISADNSQSPEAFSAESLIEQNSQAASVPSEQQNFEQDISGQPLLESAPTGEIIDPKITGEAPPEALDEAESDVLRPEGLDESQVEEDPSIAIDQFIKKIADEQLSSKRIEERKEEEAQEDTELILSDNKGSIEQEENVLTQSNISDNASQNCEPVDSSLLEEPSTEADPLDDLMTQDKAVSSEPAAEPMEVDSEIQSAEEPKTDTKLSEVDEQMSEDHDNMEAESIEQIQKEIMKMPPKKITANEELYKPPEIVKEEVNSNGTHSEEENIAQIFGTEEPKTKILKAALENEFPTPTIADSADVAKDPKLIEKAKDELKKLDVLVCGECHTTFYYIADFAEHKKSGCSQKQATKDCESEGRSQVWGFMLWKVKQTMDLTVAPSAWSLYEKWCKLPQDDRDAWITAGQAIQFATKIGTSKVTEVKPAKPAKQTTVQRVTNLISPSKESDSNKENATIDLENQVSNILKRGDSKTTKLNSDVSLVSSVKKDEFVVEKIMAKRFNPRKKTWEYNIKWEHFGHDSNTWEPVSNLSHCKKMLEQFEEQLKKMKEEKAKQAAQSTKLRGRPSNPKPGVASASNYVPIAPKIGLPTISNIVGGVSDDYGGVSSNRPQRSCKQKAMNQVKEWCGTISDEEGGVKRKHESDESDDDFDDKRIKLEEDSDFSDKDVVKVKPTPVKKVTITPVKSTSKSTSSVKNGNNTQQVLPSNILIPDANGVVRINQKQLPSLSSGVYIMSKTAGIIKLDSTTSKVATSGGQTIVKVAPKVGQTQIKIVKKDGNTTKQIIQVAPKNSGSLTSPIKIAPKPSSMVTSTPNRITSSQMKMRKEIKKGTPADTTPRILQKKVIPPVKELPKPKEPESDSDDGLEPLPFPSPDEPIPDMDEEKEPEDFILDPETGKIAGVEYVDKPVVIKEEPKPKPITSTSHELENIVKLAAADLSDDDLQNSDSMDESMLSFVPEIKSEPKTESTVTRKVPKYVPSQNQSILNRSLTQGHQKPLVTPSAKSVSLQQRRPVPKMTTQIVQQRAPAQPRTVVRHVIEPSRLGGNVNVIRKTVTSTPKPRSSLPMQKPMASPLQPARTYSAMGGIRQSSAGNKVQVFSSKSNVAASHTTAQMQGGMRRIGNTIVRSSNNQMVQRQQQVQQKPIARIVQRPIGSPVKKPMMQQVTKTVSPTKPKTVISMPSLTDDVSSSPKPQQAKPVQKPIAVPKPAPVIKQEPVLKMEMPEEPTTAAETADAEQTDWSTFTMADGEDPIYVTGDDGTIYQVAGRNEQGQTILITQGPDGQQQCLLVTNEISEMTADEPQPSTSSTATTVTAPVETTESAITTTVEAPMPEVPVAPVSVGEPMDESNLHTPLQIKTDAAELEEDDGMQDQVVAQVVRAEPPSPGGSHKVVVMLPDGNLMVTKVSPEEFASLELE